MFDYEQNKALDTNYRIPGTIAPTTKIFRDVVTCVVVITPDMVSPCACYGKDESRQTGMRILVAVLYLSDLRKAI